MSNKRTKNNFIPRTKKIFNKLFRRYVAVPFLYGNLAKSMPELGFTDTIRMLLRHYVRVPWFGQKYLFNVRFNHDIIEYYDGYLLQNTKSSKGFLGFGLMHYALITNTRPKRVLCIGSKKGFIPAMCAMACRDMKYGHVDFVDAGYSDADENSNQHWGGVGLWRNVNPKHHFSFLELSPYITTHVMTTKDFFRKNREKYQYIYIDGDHTYEGVKHDYLKAWPHLEVNGYMVFHDTRVQHIKDQLPYGVGKLWQEIKSHNKITFDVAAGLGIIQKK